MEPILAINESTELSRPSTSLLRDCICGKTWNVTMERGESGRAGCLQCSCGFELVAWSGTITFTACEIAVA